jgi:hypothetical protein
MQKTTTALLRFIQGVVFGGIATLLVLYLSRMYLNNTMGATGAMLLNWCRDNLGMSVIFFGICAVLFTVYLVCLVAMLRHANPAINKIEALESKLDLLINLFFGIGVIWTAIGMRNALLIALSGLDAAEAARMGAFVILQRLVDGGMLVALSTTIVGGLGGYIMRMIKLWVAGAGLAALYERYEHQAAADITTRLDAIAELLQQRTEGDAGSLS